MNFSFSKLTKKQKSFYSLCIAGFLNNIANCFWFTLSPIYFLIFLGGGTATLGVLESFVELFSYAGRCLIGFLSDRLEKRKLFLCLACFCNLISKSLLFLCNSTTMFLNIKLLDRTANFIQACPREGLVKDLSNITERNRFFCFRTFCSLSGSVLGGILSILILKNATKETIEHFIPILIGIVFCSFCFFCFGVKDTQPEKTEEETLTTNFKEIKKFLKEKKNLCIYDSFFLLSKFSEVILYMWGLQVLGFQKEYLPFLTIIYCFSNAMFNFFFRKKQILNKTFQQLKKSALFNMICAVIFSLSFFVHPVFFFIGAFGWGITKGYNETLFDFLFSLNVKKQQTAQGYSILYLLQGLMIFVGTNLATFLFSLSPILIFGQMFLFSLLAYLFVDYFSKVNKN